MLHPILNQPIHVMIYDSFIANRQQGFRRLFRQGPQAFPFATGHDYSIKGKNGCPFVKIKNINKPSVIIHHGYNTNLGLPVFIARFDKISCPCLNRTKINFNCS